MSYASRIILAALIIAALIPTAAYAATHRQRHNVVTIKRVAHTHGYGHRQTHALLVIAKQESDFNRLCKTGHYRGLFQLGFRHMGTKWKNARWNTKRAIKYVEHRYGTPTNALKHRREYGWY